MQKNVLLVYPGNLNTITKRMPLSILYLAESLKEKGYNPIVFDMQVDSFHESLLKNVICVGISTLTGEQIKYGIAIAQIIRKCNPTIPLVWGGIHPSIMPEQTLGHSLVDFVVYGEGEEAFPCLVTAIETKSDIAKVPNLFYKINNTIFSTPRTDFINFNKPNNLPYDLLTLSKYQTSTRFEYQSSRGCPHGCLFCYNKGFNAFKWRFKDSSIVLNELEHIEKRFNPEYLFFVDDEFFINKRRAQEIIKGIMDRGIDFKWKAAIRIDTINSYDKEMLDLLDKSGCMELPMGAESGSDRILQLVKKKISKEDIIKSAKITAGMRLVPQYSFMGGFPTDTITDLRKTIDCIDELWKINKNIKVNGLFFATPFPGTELFDIALKNGYTPPSTLDLWGDIDFILSYKNVQYIPQSFKQELIVYAFIIRFRYLWMHASSFLENIKNITTPKFWGFVVFKIVFKPFEILLSLRWKYRMTKFPFDVTLAHLILTKIAA